MLDSLISIANEHRAAIHLILHVIVPLIITVICVPVGKRKSVFLVLMATMLVDVDHLLATPIYEANRCSIMFHPLHQTLPIALYLLMAVWPLSGWALKRQLKPAECWLGWVGLGLLIHMLLDGIDCGWMRFAQ